MNKSTKGAVAVTAAATLLVGGAGTLAFWNATADVNGGSINSGKLALVNPGPSGWTMDGNPISGTVKIVPGDHLEYTGSYEVEAEGQNLKATFALTGGSASGTLDPFVTTDITVDIDGSPVGDITEAEDGQHINVHANVDFPFGTAPDNSSQDTVLNLDDLTITLTQVDV